MHSILKPFYLICQIIFAFFLGYTALHLLIYHYYLTSFPFPITLREGASMTSTAALVHGLNPFDMSLQPEYMNQYGIVYPLLVWPLAQLFTTTLLVHRIVTAISILGSCTIVFIVLKRLGVSVLLNIWAVLMLYASLIYPATSTPAVDPAATGVLFMLLAVFIPWLSKFSYKSLGLSVIFGILAFYSKPYTFLGAVVISSYIFLFVSKKKGLAYTGLLIILLALSVLMINQLLPAYFDNCFFTSLNMTAAWSSMERLHMQIDLYSHLHLWTFVLMGAFALGYGIKFIQDRSWTKIKGFDCPLVLYACLWSIFVLYISLGRHTGATLWYFFQLLSPYLLIGAAWIFSRVSFWPLACIPFLILNLLTMTKDQNYKYFDKNILEWQQVAYLINTHQHILNSPLITPLLIEQNKEFFDDGQTEYFMSGAARSGLTQKFFKEDFRVLYQGMVFFETIKSRVENQQFDLIMLQPSLLPEGVGDLIKKYYKYEGQILVYTPQDRRPYAVTVWKPL